MVMLACSMWAATSYRRMTGITTGRVPAKDRRAGKQAGSGLMMRLEERWRRRQERRPLNSRPPAAGPRASNAAAHSLAGRIRGSRAVKVIESNSTYRQQGPDHAVSSHEHGRDPPRDDESPNGPVVRRS